MGKTAITQAIEEIEDSVSFNFNEFARGHRAGVDEAVSILIKLLPLEREQIEQAYGDGMNPHRNDFCNRNEYFDRTFKNEEES